LVAIFLFSKGDKIMTTAVDVKALSKSEKLVPWWLVLIEGIAAIILGIFFLVSPLKTTVLAIQFLGIWWLVSGIMSIISLFIDRTAWGWKLFSGILGMVAGSLILMYPGWSTLVVPVTIVFIIGIQGIVLGMIGLIQAFQGAGWGAGVLGVLSVLFGIWLMLDPVKFALVTPWVVGVLAIIGGIAALVTAFRIKK
jgi:uncharacterized membrane protein HdeD (DUF308 family)